MWASIFKLPNIHEFAPDILSETTSNCPLQSVREISKTMALPSVFVWRKESPVKRKLLMKRFISCQAEKGGKNNEKQKDNRVC